MANNKTGNNQFLKQLNQTVILDLIRTNKSVSKAELSQITGLSPTATGMIVTGLLEQGYIYETGTGESKGGRRPVMLELKPGSFYSIGVDLDVNYINITLMDVTGRVVYENASKMPETINAESTARKIENRIHEVLQKNSIDADRLLGIGISVPGMVDSETQKIILAPNLGWENIDIRAYFTKLTDIPIYVENEAMASAICEHWLGSCQGVNHFVCINVKSGIGAGIFTDGKLYRGTGGSAGEVGHIVVDESGPKCGCGNYGCLETLSSTTRIVDNAKKLVRQGVVSTLNDLENIEELDINKVVEAALSGDDTAKNVLMDSARYLGIAISNIVNTLNPTKIVIGKEFVKYSNIVLEHVKNIVNCKALKLPASRVEIMSSDIGEKSSTQGAAIIPLKLLFGK
jgi:N-acetylglucosamine repressor